MAQQYFSFISPYELYRFIGDNHIRLYRCRHSYYEELCGTYQYYFPLFTSANPKVEKYAKDVFDDNNENLIVLSIKPNNKYKVVKISGSYVLVSNEKDIKMDSLVSSILAYCTGEYECKKISRLQERTAIPIKLKQ